MIKLKKSIEVYSFMDKKEAGLKFVATSIENVRLEIGRERER